MSDKIEESRHPDSRVRGYLLRLGSWSVEVLRVMPGGWECFTHRKRPAVLP